MNIQDLLFENNKTCSCGKVHRAGLSRVIVECGATSRLPEIIKSYGAKKVFILTDGNAYAAAGEQVSSLLQAEKIPYSVYCMTGKDRIEPDERAVGSVMMHYDTSCDLILGIGSGVINDLGKILANLTGRPYVIFGTAPSMDGYASASSSVVRDGLKYSLPSCCADTVIADTDVLCAAPMRMILSGLGDMIAKYISLAEWKLSHIITGEYYCPYVAGLVQKGLDLCMAHLEGLPKRDPVAVKAVMNGMVLSGVAMNLAGVSRPASGMEHYLSHIQDMRGVEFGTPTDLHGIQCGAATIEALKLYEQLRDVTPDRQKALFFAEKFSYEAWKKELRDYLGNGAEAMIENEAREGKYDKAAHAARLEVILAHWDEIQEIIGSLPRVDDLTTRLGAIGMPTSFAEIGFSKDDLQKSILMSRDIRDKYIGSRLMWDLGISENLKGESI